MQKKKALIALGLLCWIFGTVLAVLAGIGADGWVAPGGMAGAAAWGAGMLGFFVGAIGVGMASECVFRIASGADLFLITILTLWGCVTYVLLGVAAMTLLGGALVAIGVRIKS